MPIQRAGRVPGVTCFPLLAQGQDRLGTIPEWIAALGTVAAFFVALGLFAKELAARREQQEDQRRDQARRVTALAQRWPGGAERHTLIMRNNSDEPASAITVVMEHPDKPGVITRQESWDLLPPGESPEKSAFFAPVGPITLSFTDAAGRRWKRYPDGRLVEVGRRRRRSRKDRMDAWIAGELDRLDD
jgi:hypothetical protein